MTICVVAQINQKNLPYNIDDYQGELYRMNISCTAKELLRNPINLKRKYPLDGCLFFKLVGTTQVTNGWSFY